MKSAERPVFLNLMKLKFPLPAIISILHRISGVVLFLFLPLFLYLLHQSLISHESYVALQALLNRPLLKLLLWLALAAVIFHLFAGIRHLMMDLGFAESLEAGRVSAMLVMVLSVLFILLAGWWLW